MVTRMQIVTGSHNLVALFRDHIFFHVPSVLHSQKVCVCNPSKRLLWLWRTWQPILDIEDHGELL